MLKELSHFYKIAIVFLVLLIGRLLIAGNGYLDDPDEYVYHLMLFHLEELYNFEAYYWCKATFNIHFFPMEVLIRLVETKFTILYANFMNLPLDHIEVLIVPGVFNILFSLANIYIIYKILIAIGFSKNISLLGILVYGTLFTTNVYTRHILPYENSYFFHLLALYVILKNKFTFPRLLLAGFFFACGHATYFGFFMMFAVNMGYIMFSNITINWKRTILYLFYFSIPVAVYIIGFDIISRTYYNDSYIAYTLRFSETIYQGSYSEGLIFAFIHLYLIENIWGIFLLLSFFGGFYFIAFKSECSTTLKRIVTIFLLAYILFGLNAVLFEGMVFYARVFRMYYLPIVIGGLVLFEQLSLKYKLRISYLIVFVSILNYGYIIFDLNQLAYPRSEIQKNGFISDEFNGVFVENKQELICALEYKANDRFVGINKTELKEGKYTLINSCFFYHEGDLSEVYTPIKINDEKVLYRKKHFMSHPSYTLEYCSKEGRKVFLGNSIYITLIKNDEKK